MIYMVSSAASQTACMLGIKSHLAMLSLHRLSAHATALTVWALPYLPTHMYDMSGDILSQFWLRRLRALCAMQMSS